MVKEYEAMQEDNTSSVLEEFEESKNNTNALDEILDDVECEGNSVHSHIRSLNVQLEETTPRDRRGRFCTRRYTPRTRRTTGHMSLTNQKSLISPKILLVKMAIMYR